MFGDEMENKQLDAIISTYPLVPKYITADHIFLSLEPSGLQSLINYFQSMDIVKCCHSEGKALYKSSGS